MTRVRPRGQQNWSQQPASGGAGSSGRGLLRVVGGQWRGRKLEAPDRTLDVRPTAERTREALFNKLAHADFGSGRGATLQGRVLDACCGTGALGIEAMSRGAPAATFLDRDSSVLQLLRRNLATVGAGGRSIVVAGDATAPPPPPVAHDLLLIDPPYGQDIAGAALTALHAAGWLSSGAVAVVELPARVGRHAAGTRLAWPTPFVPVDDRQYGAAWLWFLRAEVSV